MKHLPRAYHWEGNYRELQLERRKLREAGVEVQTPVAVKISAPSVASKAVHLAHAALPSKIAVSEVTIDGSGPIPVPSGRKRKPCAACGGR